VAGGLGQGWKDGVGDAAQFSTPKGICWDKDHNLLVCDSRNSRIRRVNIKDKTVTTVLGDGQRKHAEGTALKCSLQDPTFVACDSAGNIYVTCEAGQDKYVVRKWDAKEDKTYTLDDVANFSIHHFNADGTAYAISATRAQPVVIDGLTTARGIAEAKKEAERLKEEKARQETLEWVMCDALGLSRDYLLAFGDAGYAYADLQGMSLEKLKDLIPEEGPRDRLIQFISQRWPETAGNFGGGATPMDTSGSAAPAAPDAPPF